MSVSEGCWFPNLQQECFCTGGTNERWLAAGGPEEHHGNATKIHFIKGCSAAAFNSHAAFLNMHGHAHVNNRNHKIALLTP